jgi:hypothetical protein
MPFIVPPSSITGVLQFFWIDSNGDSHDLNQHPDLFVKVGSVGLGDAEFEIESDKFPSSAGSLMRRINTRPREITLPIIVHDEDISGLILTVEDMHDWFDTGDETEKRPGTLRVIRPDDSVRDIKAYKVRGMEGDTSVGSVTWAEFDVELFCPDPYPTDSEETFTAKTVAQAASFAIINQGRLEAYPVIILTGPFTNFTLRNVTRSDEEDADIEIVGAVSLLVDEFLVIDTRPSETRPGFSVYDNLNANRISVVSPTSVFWSLKPGSNVLEFTFGSGTTAATTVQISYLARYRSLLR